MDHCFEVLVLLGTLAGKSSSPPCSEPLLLGFPHLLASCSLPCTRGPTAIQTVSRFRPRTRGKCAKGSKQDITVTCRIKPYQAGPNPLVWRSLNRLLRFGPNVPKRTETRPSQPVRDKRDGTETREDKPIQGGGPHGGPRGRPAAGQQSAGTRGRGPPRGPRQP